MKSSNKNDNDYIPLKDIFLFFIRNKINIFLFTFIGVLISATIPIKSSWMGKSTLRFKRSFDKVIISGNKSQNFIKFTNNPYTNDENAYKIFKENSFLQEIYKYSSSKEEDQKNLGFKKWKDKLIIQHDKNNGKLIFTYKAKNKDSIYQVLNKINQNYSNKAHIFKKNSLDKNLIDYKSLIKKYKVKNDNSIKNIYYFINSNKIKDIDIVSLYYYLNTNNGTFIDNKQRQLKINKIDKFKNNSPAKLVMYINLLESASHNSSILNRLIREKTLIDIEKNLKKEPWISKSKISIDKVKSNSKFKLISLGFILGLISGIFYSIFIDSKKNIIYSKYGFDENKYFSIISEIKIKNNKISKQDFKILKKVYLDNQDNNYLFIVPKIISEKNILIFKKEIEKNINKNNFKISNEVLDHINYSNTFILVNAGFTKRDEFNYLCDLLHYAKSNIIGIIILSN